MYAKNGEGTFVWGARGGQACKERAGRGEMGWDGMRREGGGDDDEREGRKGGTEG